MPPQLPQRQQKQIRNANPKWHQLKRVPRKRRNKSPFHTIHPKVTITRLIIVCRLKFLRIKHFLNIIITYGSIKILYKLHQIIHFLMTCSLNCNFDFHLQFIIQKTKSNKNLTNAFKAFYILK